MILMWIKGTKKLEMEKKLINLDDNIYQLLFWKIKINYLSGLTNIE